MASFRNAAAVVAVLALASMVDGRPTGRPTRAICNAQQTAKGFSECDGFCRSPGYFLDATKNCGSCGVDCNVVAPTAVENAETACNEGACGFECNDDFCEVEGACVANTAPTSCGADCTDCTANPTNVENAQTACVEGVCGFECNTDYCEVSGACVSNTSDTSCGADCTDCTVGGTSTDTCQDVGGVLTCAAPV